MGGRYCERALPGILVKSLLQQPVSDIAEDCVKEAALILRLLDRVSDAACFSDQATEQELRVALAATRNALMGIRQVVELETTRAGL